MKQIKQMFREINDDIFNGQLDMPKFIYWHDNCYGHYTGIFGIDIICLSPILCHDYETIFGTLAHEMAHMADYTLNGTKWKKIRHGAKFKKICREISDFYDFPLDKIL